MSRACRRCGARLSRYAEIGDEFCLPCFRTAGEHIDLIDAVARANGEPETVCKRGHDLDEYGAPAMRTGGRPTRICLACKRERDAGYARKRRARERTIA